MADKSISLTDFFFNDSCVMISTLLPENVDRLLETAPGQQRALVPAPYPTSLMEMIKYIGV